MPFRRESATLETFYVKALIVRAGFVRMHIGQFGKPLSE